jgi:hypothetical protein
MKRLIVNGDPGIRKDAEITVDDEELVAFQVTRNGDWHGPDRVQLWCVVGTEDEREAYVERDFVPHWLDVERVEDSEVEVRKKGGDLVV